MTIIQWDKNAKQYSAQAHDRPAPPLFAPCVTFGFSLRPKFDNDPIAVDPESDLSPADLRRQWTERNNKLLSVFEHPRFRPQGAIPPALFDPSVLQTSPSEGADGKGGATGRFQLGSKNIRLRWNNGLDEQHADYWELPGYVVVDQLDEYTSYFFTISLHERDAPRMSNGEKPRDITPFFQLSDDMSYPRRLAKSLEHLSFSEEALLNAGEDLGSIAKARDFALEELWNTFLGDLEQVWRAKFPDETGAVFPGEAFGAVKTIVTREDSAWKTANDDRSNVSPYVGDEAYAALEARRSVLRCFFNGRDGDTNPDRNRNREFIGSLTINDQALFVSTLGSTQLEGADYEPTQNFLLLKDRPDAPQLGRMVERLHALETLRTAALIDYDDMIQLGVELRHLGAELDDLGAKGRANQEELQELLERISLQSDNVRGGVTYRIGQASLYSAAFFRRLEELRSNHVETWMPYDVFAQRRLKETFDFIAELEDQRNFLFTRIQLLLQRNMERDATESLVSTNAISWIASIAAPMAVGAAMGKAATAAYPVWNWFFDWPADALDQLNGATFGLGVGLVLLVIITAAQSRRS